MFMQAMTPVASHAEQLLDNGVPLHTIIHIVESHYTETIARLEAELSDSLLASLNDESARAQLAKANAKIAELQRKVQLSVDRSTALQNAMSSAAAAAAKQQQPMTSMALLDAAQAQQQTDASRKTSTAQKAVVKAGGADDGDEDVRGQLVSLRLFTQSLQKQLDQTTEELSNKSALLTKTLAMRKRLELDNHTLQMHAMALHDDMSKVNMALETTVERLKTTIARADDDRQSLLGTVSDLRSNLESLTQRSNSEISMLTLHVAELERQLARQKKMYSELKEDYLAATRNAAGAGAEYAATMGQSDDMVRGASSTLDSPASLGGGRLVTTHDAVQGLMGALEDLTKQLADRQRHCDELRTQLRIRDEELIKRSGGTMLDVPRMIACEPQRITAGPDDRAPADASIFASPAATTPPRRIVVSTGPASASPQMVTAAQPKWQSSAVAAASAPAVELQVTMSSSAARRPRRSPAPAAQKRLLDATVTGWSPGTDAAVIQRLTKSLPSVVSLDGALDFVGGLTPLRATINKRAPHHVQPIAVFGPTTVE